MIESIRKLYVYRKRNFKFDFIAAIVVFLVAIPLCLGIALASGAPLFSGILSGVIGGIVVGSLSGSHVSVSGPAAGMAAVVLAAITQLGSFDAFLLALFLAGVLQLIVGICKAGFVADYIPSNVIQGLLCAIGILLIIKQLPFAFTLSSNLAELKHNLLQETSDGVSLRPLYELSSHINSGAVIISLLSFFILITFDKAQFKWSKVIPGPIVVVIAGILLNEWFLFSDSSLAQNSPQLVNLPRHDGFADFIAQIKTPDWAAWENPKVYMYAAILAVVASLESLLNIKASEKLDKLRRYCSKDRELVAQGIGNMCTGLLGGIPVTSVVVRSSVSIQAGSKTKFATILHGIFILVSVALIPQVLNKIPLSSLAAILIHTGYKLTKPAIFASIFRQGMDRFIPFLVTIIGIVVFNLLAGILVGLMVSLFFILKSNSQTRIDIIKEIYPTGEINRLILPQQMTFLNKAPLIAELDSIPTGSQLIIDARYASYLDKEIIQVIEEFQQEQAPHKNISLNLMGFQEHYNIHNYIDFINVTTFDVQANIPPAQVLNILREGNQRFLKDIRIHRTVSHDIKPTALNPHPVAVVLGCIDSRVPVETIFDMGFGDLFCIRIAGNVVNEDILASMEYACNIVGAKLIVVLGHTRCGAIQAACNENSASLPGHICQLLSKIKPSLLAETQTLTDRNHENQDFIYNITELNIANTLQQIYQQSSILRGMIEKNTIGIVGAMYLVNTGEVRFKDYSGMVRQLDPQPDNELPLKLHQLME